MIYEDPEEGLDEPEEDETEANPGTPFSSLPWVEPGIDLSGVLPQANFTAAIAQLHTLVHLEGVMDARVASIGNEVIAVLHVLGAELTMSPGSLLVAAYKQCPEARRPRFTDEIKEVLRLIEAGEI